jgi:anaerobic C4-dicarboxylate transporter
MNFLKSTPNLVWLVLLLATAITYWLGESGTTRQAGSQAVLIMFGLAWLKGYLVIAEFMELRQAPLKWQAALLGWLSFVLGMILLAYWIGTR